MFQGTGSDVGKSLITAGLCRAFAQRGLRVRPFKPQNMSNNAAVASHGGEIGRAQALQARACGVAPSVHMNPVLLKPQTETGSQIVVQGRIFGQARARDYQALKPRLMESVLDSYARIDAEADLVLIEGAGGAAEINLRAGDIANMGFARAIGAPVVLIGDIDRGGVIAQIVGAHAVLDPADAAAVRGFIVNKFRGDASLFDDGMLEIARRTQWRALGLVPFFAAASRLPAEDAMALSNGALSSAPREGGVIIAVPLLPRIANFDDFDPLRAEPDARLVFVRAGEPLPVCHLVVLPGSKATIPDLDFFRAQGWDVDLRAHVRRGGRVLGVCGGYQMLGRRILDPLGLESETREAEGLGLLNVETVLTDDKTLARCEGISSLEDAPFVGYEMHVGRTDGPDCARPVLRFSDGRVDGASSPDGRVLGCYAHGLFAHDAQRAVWMRAAGGRATDFSYDAQIERTLDELAAHLGAHIDLDALLTLAQ